MGKKVGTMAVKGAYPLSSIGFPVLRPHGFSEPQVQVIRNQF
jgi:hypothetical protein